jgi:8-oxo-dGTP diphosphatase
LDPVSTVCEQVVFFHKSINKILPTRRIMERNPTMLFVVAAALINQSGDIFVQKRPTGKAMAGLWEFPGGKVEAGEVPKQALVRELREEIGIEIRAEDLIPATFASEPVGSQEMLLLLYICRIWSGEPSAIECPADAWVSCSQMRQLDMPPADIPFIDYLAAITAP